MTDKKNKMVDTAILQARNLKFSPKILRKYFKNRFLKNVNKKKIAYKKNKMADSAILRASDVIFSPKIQKKYLK